MRFSTAEIYNLQCLSLSKLARQQDKGNFYSSYDEPIEACERVDSDIGSIVSLAIVSCEPFAMRKSSKIVFALAGAVIKFIPNWLFAFPYGAI